MAISYLTFIKHAEKMVKDIGFAKPALKGFTMLTTDLL